MCLTAAQFSELRYRAFGGGGGHGADRERYQHLVGKTAILPLVGRELPIVADDYVELDFGTGCVKMTPCHDPNDYEVGLRHNLEQIQCIDEDAKIINGGKYNGLDRYEARKAIVADLEEQGYLIKTEPYNHNVGTCYRCGTTVEPMTCPLSLYSVTSTLPIHGAFILSV